MIKYIIIGFVAQMIDGTMGMAYGVSSRTCLRIFAGADAVAASAVVHCSEVFTSLVSGISHVKLKNFNKEVLLKLMIPGAIGGCIGSWFLSSWGNKLEVFIDLYLILMGVRILYMAFKRHKNKRRFRHLTLLGLAGGFLDAAGGGGWGPVVTSSLVAGGEDVKKTIGSVNIAEFVVTLAETTTFVVFYDGFHSYANIIMGLVAGGVLAAPLAALLCKRAPIRFLLAAIGTLLVILNIYSLGNVILSY